MPNIENFKGSFTDFVRPNRFRVFGFGAGINLQYYATSTSAPAATIGVVEAPYQGRTIKLPGDRTYDVWTMNVLEPVNNGEYGWFYDWNTRLNEVVQNTGTEEKWDGTVELLDRKGDLVIAWAILGAFVSEVGTIDLAHNSNDTLAEFTVSFAYDYHQVLVF